MGGQLYLVPGERNVAPEEHFTFMSWRERADQEKAENVLVLDRKREGGRKKSEEAGTFPLLRKRRR